MLIKYIQDRKILNRWGKKYGLKRKLFESNEKYRVRVREKVELYQTISLRLDKIFKKEED